MWCPSVRWMVCAGQPWSARRRRRAGVGSRCACAQGSPVGYGAMFWLSRKRLVGS